MLSLETAKKLKAAGLQWEPQMGDFFYNNGVIDCLDNCDMDFAAGYEDLTHKGDVGFIPRLGQMLAEIEKRWGDYTFTCTNHDSPQYKISLEKVTDWDGFHILEGEFNADTPGESAAQALLWILEQEAKA